jgi:hypothetical protein
MAPKAKKTDRKLARRPESTPLALAKLLGIFVAIAVAAEGINAVVDWVLVDRAPTGPGKYLVPFQSGFFTDALLYVTLDSSSVGTRIVSRAMFAVVIGFFLLLLVGRFTSEERTPKVQLAGLAVIAIFALGVGPYASLYLPLELTIVDSKSRTVTLYERESFLYAGVKPGAKVDKKLSFSQLAGFTVRYVGAAEDSSGRSFIELYAVKNPPRPVPGKTIAKGGLRPVLVGRAQVRGGLLDVPKYLRSEESDKKHALQGGREAAVFLTEVVLRPAP